MTYLALMWVINNVIEWLNCKGNVLVIGYVHKLWYLKAGFSCQIKCVLIDQNYIKLYCKI